MWGLRVSDIGFTLGLYGSKLVRRLSRFRVGYWFCMDSVRVQQTGGA